MVSKLSFYFFAICKHKNGYHRLSLEDKYVVAANTYSYGVPNY